MEKSSEPQIISLPKICDPRGNLSVIESLKNIPFKIARAYWIYDVPAGKVRHGHAFKTQDEFIVALSGSFDIVFDNGIQEERFHLSRSYYGIYIPHLTWRKLDNFSTNAVALILSSRIYDPEDYIEDFEEFKSLREQCYGKYA